MKRPILGLCLLAFLLAGCTDEKKPGTVPPYTDPVKPPPPAGKKTGVGTG